MTTYSIEASDARIKHLMESVGHPNSMSLYSALKSFEQAIRTDCGQTQWPQETPPASSGAGGDLCKDCTQLVGEPTPCIVPYGPAPAAAVAPEVPGDVEEGAYEASIKAAIAEGFGNSDRRLVRVVLNASAPLIAAAAEAKARQAAAICADQWSVPSNVRLAAGEMTAQELRTAQAVARGIAAAIRTGAAS